MANKRPTITMLRTHERRVSDLVSLLGAELYSALSKERSADQTIGSLDNDYMGFARENPANTISRDYFSQRERESQLRSSSAGHISAIRKVLSYIANNDFGNASKRAKRYGSRR